MNLLSEAKTSAKMAKNLQFEQYQSYILYLAPATEATPVSVCPGSSPGCRAACLFTAGRGKFSNVKAARIRKTRLYFSDHNEFVRQLHEDLDRVQRRATKAGKIPVVRLNGTSDLDWGFTISKYPGIQFYDYTKLPRRLRHASANYHVTLSSSECNDRICKLALGLGHNVAMVFAGKQLPETYWGFRVVSGDEHDFRFLDPRGCIIGLLAKGDAKKDDSGFVKSA